MSLLPTPSAWIGLNEVREGDAKSDRCWSELLEHILLGVVALTLALSFATAMTHGLAALIPPDPQGVVAMPDFTPDWQGGIYAMVLTIAAGVLFTIAPAVRAWRQDALPALKTGEHNVAQGRSRIMTGLVLMQMAFSVVLLTSAGLAYRSLAFIEQNQVGFQTGNILLVTANTTAAATSSDDNRVLLDAIRQRLESIAGVKAVSYARAVPGTSWGAEELQTHGSAVPVPADRNDVGPQYFEVLGVTPLQGVASLTDTRAGSNSAR